MQNTIHYILISLVALLLGHVVVGFLKKLRKNLPIMTRKELSLYNGKDKPLIYLGCNWRVYDVSSSQAYKPPEGAYQIFAGKDASVALARMALTEEEADKKLEETELTKKELKVLKEWVTFFNKKYPLVGRIVPQLKKKQN